MQGRSENVAQLAMTMGRVLGLTAIETGNLWLAGIVHDVGEKNIAGEILNKPGSLDKDERQQVESHVESSVKIIEQTSFPPAISQIVAQHHERLDGSGYPTRLKGEEIILGARILAVADVYDALISERPYRAAFSEDDALSFMKSKKDLLFDPAVIDALFKIIKGVDSH